MITVVDYGASNLSSISNMLRKIDVAAEVTADPDVVRRASKLLLPGVGAFDAGMAGLQARGLDEAMAERVRDGVPVLGVCLGAQLFTRRSDEGGARGLGWLGAETVAFDRASMALSEGRALPVPHMGWSELALGEPSRLLQALPDEARFYFCHSYHLAPDLPGMARATVSYGYPFAAVLEHENVVAAQFHPEKSHRYGMAVLRNFSDRY